MPKTKVSGVACMYACMLEHPHHFDKKNEKREREREKSENYGKDIR